MPEPPHFPPLSCFCGGLVPSPAGEGTPPNGSTMLCRALQPLGLQVQRTFRARGQLVCVQKGKLGSNPLPESRVRLFPGLPAS